MHAILNYNVSFPGLGIHDLSISRIAFQFNLFGRQVVVYWYGLLFAIAMVLCLVLAARHAKYHHLASDDIVDLFLWMVPSILIGARIYYVIFEWDQFKGNWKSALNFREGGLAFYGGVIGGIISVVVVAKVKKMKLHRPLDFLAVYVPLGQAIGRWGNFFNQEAFGTNTSLPWGMISEGTRRGLASVNPDPANPLPGIDPALPVHPTFLYEFIANMIIFVILIYVRRNIKRPWVTFHSYLFLYGLVRFFVEGIRTDSLMFTFLGYNLRVSQVLSALMVLASVAFLIAIYLRGRQRDRIMASLAGVPADIVEVSEIVAEDTDEDVEE
ncbi:MAG TPA: prolipoprotein diacylglyceryl transferase [Clostridiaceae bacterium]|nr:prolipoprotein diacylglyceryl transferase [Clostridiaceae bacterium]